MRVLLIEDDSATAQSIELMLKSESFNVYTTDLGEEGVDLGKLYDYDIILLDLNLPDMSGYEVLRTLRLSKVKTPILILSGMAGIEDKVRGLGFGADDYMTKPVDLKQFRSVVASAVQGTGGVPAPRAARTGGVQGRQGNFSADPLAAGTALDRLVGTSEAMRNVKQRVAKVARVVRHRSKDNNRISFAM